MRSFILFLLLLFVFTACKSGVDSNQESTTAKRYNLKGKVISVDRTAKKAKIEHGPIEGYMDAMTMDFPIHADWVWNDLLPGSEITAELVVDSSAKDPYFLENIGIIAVANPNMTPPPLNDNFVQIGKETPDVSLVNQDGKRISLKDFRGPALRVLDEFLSALEAKHPNLLYVHDMNLYELVTRGKFKGPRGPVSVEVRQGEGRSKSMTHGAS